RVRTVTGVQTCALPILLAVVPGLPTVPFLTLAVVLGAIAWRLLRAPAARTADATATGTSVTGATAGAAGGGMPEAVAYAPVLTRSEERRVGKGWRAGGG